MPTLTQWADRHHITPEALTELRALLIAPGVMAPPITDHPPGSEAAVQQLVRLEAAAAGVHLWRNNVGVARDARGVPIRFGLANDTSAMNKRIKSSDLIGIRPGGQMVVREIKRPGWVYTGTPREVAQLRWMELILGMGGDACFANSEGTI